MKKTLLIAALTIFSAVTLTACTSTGGPGSKNNPTPAFNTATPTPSDTPTPTVTPTPKPTDIPIIITNKSLNTCVFLGDYKGLRLSPVTNEEVNERVNAILSDYAEEVEVDRPAKLGDIAVIYFIGKINDEPFEGGTYLEGSGYELVLGSGNFIESFEEQLIGAKKDDELEVFITFPDDYYIEDMRGKSAVFDVSVNFVLEYVTPELTDEFALNTLDHVSANDFINSVREELSETSYKNQITEQLLSGMRIENLPDSEIRAYADSIYNYYYKTASIYSAYLNIDIDKVLRLYFDLDSLDELRSIADFIAPTQKKLDHIFKAIAVNEGIEITEEDVNEWVLDNLDDYNYETPEAMILALGYDNIVNTVTDDIIYDFVLKNCIIE